MTARTALLLCLAVPLSGCSIWDADSEDRRSAKVERPPSVAGVELYPVPRPVIDGCRYAQERARIPVLCPSRLPRPSRRFSESALPPDSFAAAALHDRRESAHNGRGSVIGVDLSYSAEGGDPRENHPDRFLHFDVKRQDQPLPPRVRRARLGGKSGLLAPATSRVYVGEPYFANHVRFFWTERGAKYAATLHDFGPGTRELLGALIADLRPADRLRTPRRGSDGRGVKTIALPVQGPIAVAVGAGGVWVAAQGGLHGLRDPDAIQRAALIRVGPASGQPSGAPVPISSFVGAVAVAADDAVWVAHRAPRRTPALRRLDPKTSRFVGSVEARPELVAVALADESVWAVDFGGFPGDRTYHGGAVKRVDPETNRVVATVPVGRAPASIAIGEGGVWVPNNLDDTVTRIDPRTDRVVGSIRVGAEPVGVAAGSGAVWVTNGDDSTVTRIDPATNDVVETIGVGRRPRGIAVGEGGVWVANELDDTVSRIDPETNEVVETIPVGAGPTGVTAGRGAVWVANNLDRTVSRIEPRAR